MKRTKTKRQQARLIIKQLGRIGYTYQEARDIGDLIQVLCIAVSDAKFFNKIK